MSDNGYRKPKLMRELGVDYWLNLPLEDLEHLMSSLFSEEIRVFAALLRCSLCYPHGKRVAIRPKLRNGTFEDWVGLIRERIAKRRPVTQADMDDEVAELDDDGTEVKLRMTDLCRLLAMRHTSVIRALTLLREKGLLEPGFPFYICGKPSVVPPDDECISTDTFFAYSNPLKIADLFIRLSTDTPPETVQWAEALRTEWRQRLNSLREEFRTRVRERSTEPGILISSSSRTYKNGIKKGGKKEEEEPPPPRRPLRRQQRPQTRRRQPARRNLRRRAGW